MKKLISTLIAITTISLTTFGQVPEGFKYQSVLRDAGNIILNNQAVGMQMTIRQGSAGGTVVYQEIFVPTTNAFGLINLEIGNGTVVSGDIALIDWVNGPYFIETAVDVTGGTSYVVMGTSQLMSVPYALYAKNVENSDNLGNHVLTQNIELGSFFISGNGTDRGISVDAIGEVGINTPTPGAGLHLTQKDTDISDGIRYTSSHENGQDWYVYMDHFDNLTIRDDFSDVMTFQNATNFVGINTGVPTANLSVSGTANKTGGGSWTVFSDLRIKKDVSEYTDGLDALMKIKPVKFKYIEEFAMKQNPEKEFVGIIAQEMQNIAPYMVESFKYNPEEETTGGGEDASVNKVERNSRLTPGQELLSYDPSALIYMLVNSVQEQQETIKLQEEKNEELQLLILELQKRLEVLEEE